MASACDVSLLSLLLVFVSSLCGMCRKLGFTCVNIIDASWDIEQLATFTDFKP